MPKLMSETKMKNANGKNEKKTAFIRKIIIIAALITAACFILYFFSSFFFCKNNTSKIEQNGLRYGKSAFYQYKGKIYVLIYGEGMVNVKNADVPTFKALDPNDFYAGENIGLDKNYVYFGNTVISDLKPDTLYAVGNGYFSDGVNNYFCSAFSELNGKKYSYPYKKLDTNKTLNAMKDLPHFATDEEKIFYRGEHVTGAKLGTFKAIEGETCPVYFTDGNNVYYKSTLLPITHNDSLKTIDDKYQNISYLYDEKNGSVFAGDYFLDTAHAPYKIIGAGGEHNYTVLLISEDGVYFYNSKKREQEKIGDAIFKGRIEAMTPAVFSDEENIYYLHAYEVRTRKIRRGAPELLSLNTGVYYFDKKEGWEKVTDIRDGRAGAVWQKENTYYYFDNEGMSQLINYPIYKISDKETLDYLSDSSKLYQINIEDKIRGFIRNKKLLPVIGKEKMTAVIKYKGNFDKMSIAKIIIVLCGAVIGIYLRYSKKKKLH